MAGVIFTHSVGALNLRLPPQQVEYEYNLNVAKTPTHGGEVVQLLSMNFNKLILEGQFGIEGPHGTTITQSGPLIERPRSTFFSVNKGPHAKQPYAIGLTQMTEYFRSYFNVASQGFQRNVNGNLIRANHNQEPMTIQYQTELEEVMRRWTGYPVAFPSYKRSNEDFAPMWHIEFEVEEADKLLIKAGLPSELRRLRAAVGYQAFNPFSDPIGQRLENRQLTGVDPKKTLNFARTQAEMEANKTFDELSAIVATDPTSIIGLLQQGASRPVTTHNNPANSSPTK